MVHRPAVDNRLCFVVMPFRDPFNGYYTDIIKPAIADAGLEALRGDEIYGTQSIIRDIWDQIWRARIVIADVTDKNPNVNYELGLCHALGVPTILITRRMEDVPFDYRHRRCILYITETVGWDRKLRESLSKTIKAVLSSPPQDEELEWPYSTEQGSAIATAPSLLVSANTRDIVIHGAQTVYRLLSKSFGPVGSYVSVSIDKREPAPHKQGINIAQGIRASNPLEQRGIEQMKLVAQETYRLLGDGTKLAVILAYSMIEYGNTSLKRGFLPRDVIRGMKKAVDFTAERIRVNGMPVSDELLMNIAATAATDREVGRWVMDAFEKVGRNGGIAVEESDTAETSLDIIEGEQFDSGYLSPYFITDPEHMEVVYENPLILICAHKISSMKDLLPILEQVAKIGKALLIIAENVDGEALATLVVNKLRGTLNVSAVKAPYSGDKQKAKLEDLAMLTGGMVIGAELVSLEQAKLEDLGRAKKVIIDKSTTTILEDPGRKGVYAQPRAGGVATIRVGAISSMDLVDTKYRFESAIRSARTAIEEGCDVGGGLSLFHISKLLFELPVTGEAEAAGVEIVAHALGKPISHLIENAQVSLTKVTTEIEKATDLLMEPFGFNADTREVENLMTAGILDSAKTLRSAVEIAFSHARVMLQTGDWDLSGLEAPGEPTVPQ